MTAAIPRRKRRKLKSEINVVPYIDVMLVLLIIFMVTAPLLSLSVDVDLPKANARSVESKQDPVIVTVDAEGRYFLTLEGAKAEPIDATELSTRLAAFVAQNRDLPVFVAVLGCAVVFFAVTFIAAEWASRLAALSYPRSALLAMTTAARNAPLMIGLTSAALPHQPLVTTAIVVGMLVEFPHLLAVRHLLLRRRRGQRTGRRLRGTAAWGHP